jgi:short-subunit dehydrogenase
VSKGLAGKVGIVTGASSGIGWALANVLAERGCKVGLLARREERLRSLAQTLQDRGGEAAWATADIGDRGRTVEAIRQLQGELGPVDLLVANAGVGMPTRLDPFSVADVEKMFRVNFLGVVYAIEAVLPEMLERRQGHLAAISSLGGYKGMPGESGYCASKAAVNVFMEGLRIHLRGHHIDVTTVCPGFVRTPMTEINQFHMPWLLDADEAARRIVAALERRRKVFNFPWQTALLMKLTAWLPDWVLARVMRDYNKKPPMPVP